MTEEEKLQIKSFEAKVQQLIASYSALKKDILDDLSFSAGIMKLDSAQLKSLVAFLNSHDGYHLDELQDLIYKVYDDFVKIYQRLIPALALHVV